MSKQPSKAGVHWLRRICQGFFLIVLGEFAFYGVFRCPFAVPYVSCGNCPVEQCPGRRWWIPVWIAILGSGLLMGRVFCGWACPGGVVADLLGKVVFLGRRMSAGLQRVLGIGKYIVFAAAVIMVVIWANPRWAIPIRTGDFFRSVKLTFQHADSLWLIRTVFVLTAIGLGVAVSHFWCRFLCPTGGVLEALNKVSFWRYGTTSACDDCGKCQRMCPVGTTPAEANCNNCGDCVNVCPVRAIELKTKD